ncbi:MAG: hypothetical protein DRP74_03370 [Candidatus Omnitrophota bacterium]|nr:MAG: hypothetical protein DRP74_03370 [Candidatus Omnitrophota bacterium]
MRQFGIDEDNTAKEKINQNFITLLKFEIQRARQYYQKATTSIKMIRDLRTRFVVLAMKEMYAAILGQIEKNNYVLFPRRIFLSKMGKIFIILKMVFRLV